MTHKLVPIEPTEEMIEAGDSELQGNSLGGCDCRPDKIYDAMLAAAPPAKGLAEMLEIQPDKHCYELFKEKGGWSVFITKHGLPIAKRGHGPTPEKALSNALREVG